MRIKFAHVSAGVAFLLIALLLYQNYSLKKMQQQQAISPQGHSDKTPRAEDPYRSKAVRNTILRNADSFGACYRTYLTKNPPVTAGKVKMDWQIADSGRVKSAGVVSSQLSDKDFHSCLSKVVSAIEFPAPPTDDYYVEHTFTFEKEKAVSSK